ncbi:hypothetical protein K2X89_07385, partial [Myxococcota bacterium]|nr:hypothetical protein [Myxococcota bacterium]
VERKRFQVERLAVRERVRDVDTDADAPWQDLDTRVAPLAGRPIIPGLARRVFELLGTDAEAQPLRDALLQLAPGFIQITAALMDHAERAPKAMSRDSEPATPSVSGIGGLPDSCYVWRRDSPFTIARRQAMLPSD